MVLVEYSDSESDTSNTAADDKPQQALNESRKRKADQVLEDNNTATKKPPPLPSTFHSLYATNVRTSTSDDPSLHGGRKRQVVHVQGNWPSHVYLEWLPDRDQLKQLDEIIAEAQRTIAEHYVDATDTNMEDFKLNPFLRSTLSAQLPLHVSLSAPLVLSTSSKDGFRAKLADGIHEAKVGVVGVQPASVDLVPNFEGSRWFLVLRLSLQGDGVQKLHRILEVCNRVCRRFGLTELYRRGKGIGVEARSKETEDTSWNETTAGVDGADGGITNAFHISVAWMLKGGSETVREAVKKLDLETLRQQNIEFDRVKIKIGNVVDDIPL